MRERIVESIAGWGAAPLFACATLAFVMTAVGVTEAVRWYRGRR